MAKIDTIFDHIRTVFAEQFPTTNLWQRRDPVGDEVFFLIDDPDLFDSDPMQDLIIDCTEKFLWGNDIYNVYFAADSGLAFDSISFESFVNVATAAFVFDTMSWSIPAGVQSFDLPTLKSAA